MKEPSIFMKAFDKVGHQANARRSDKKVVYLPYDDNELAADKLLNILPMKEASFLANLLIIFPDLKSTTGCTAYDLVTSRLIGPDAESNQPLYLDKWNSCDSNFQKDADLFPHTDLSNMYGKTLKVACFTYKPYVLLDVDTSVIATGRDGTEMRIVEEFCRWINCTIEIVNSDEEQWGELYENGTGIGVLGNVYEDRADVGITALYSWFEEFLYLDFSSASIRTAITCIAPAPRLLISWEMPLAPFDWHLWICMILTIIVSALVLIMAQGTSDKAFLISFGILAAQSYNDSNSSWRIRRVTGWLIVAGLILCNAYGAGLASTFTVPKFERAIDTIQDILDTKAEWSATHDAWIFSITLSQEPRIKQLVRQFKIHNFEELKRRSYTRNLLFSVEKLPSGSFAIGEYITEEAVGEFRLMQEDFYYEQNVAMLRKSSMYTQKISALIECSNASQEFHVHAEDQRADWSAA
ncbi:ligand-gated ion channel domain-containing protein [Phthorimaea operculella]|nr:ligand-gated ion channel domain-containing protein [Phthorimaea operculella]